MPSIAGIEGGASDVVEHEEKKLKEMTEEFDLIKTNLDILK